ncbi:MAG: PAS domain S-box protein [Oscillatoria sp. Prado101]|jgi:PAS domain S-box-containing protein|nr:PAS domain S-box protein [Oscillatoria sp. Prado101]
MNQKQHQPTPTVSGITPKNPTAAAQLDQLRAAISSLGAGLCLLDPAGCLVSVNPEGERLLGWTEAELAGLPLLELVELPHAPSRPLQLPSALANSPTCRNCDGRFRRKDGTILPVSYVLNPIVEDGVPTGAVLAFFDITDRKRAELALARSEANNRALIDAIPDLMFRLTSDGTFTDFKSAKGADLSVLLEREFLGKNVRQVLPATVAENLLYHIGQALSKGEIQIFEYHLLLNGDRCDYEARLAVSGEEEVVAIVRDITDRKRGEEALRQSEEKYRSVVDSVKEVIFQADAGGFLTFLNPAWTEITGFAQEDSLGTHFLNYVHPEDCKPTVKFFKKLLAGKKDCSRHEARCLTKKGGFRWVEVQARLMLDEQNRLAGSSGILNDITERKLAEDSLRDRIEFENLIASLSTNFINLAPDEIDSGIERALQAIGEFAGVDRSYIFEIAGQGTALDCTHEWCAPGFEPQKPFLQGVPVESLPWLMQKLLLFENVYIQQVASLPPVAKAEKEHWIEQNIQSLVVIPMVCGRSLKGLLGFDSVRSEKTWTEESVALLKMVAEMLANALERQRTEAQLQRAAGAAQAANRAKSLFLANMSHELRTPLNAIIGYSEILLEEAKDLGYPELAPDLDKIRAAGNHLLALINDILDISKIEAGRMSLYLESFDIFALVDSVVATIQPLVQKNGNTLEVDCDPALGTMHADMTKVRQVLFNLLSNAGKFTSKGRISLAVRREQGVLGSSVAGEMIIFTVSDTGIGIPAEQLQNIFQPFTQADTSITRLYGGTGLGLAISQRFCVMMGGEIAVTSEVGAGSTFTVRLPEPVKVNL